MLARCMSEWHKFPALMAAYSRKTGPDDGEAAEFLKRKFPNCDVVVKHLPSGG